MNQLILALHALHISSTNGLSSSIVASSMYSIPFSIIPHQTFFFSSFKQLVRYSFESKHNILTGKQHNNNAVIDFC